MFDGFDELTVEVGAGVQLRVRRPSVAHLPVASGEQPPERIDPSPVDPALVDGGVERALRLTGRMSAATWTVLRFPVEIGKGMHEVPGIDMSQPERSDPGSVDHPAAGRQRQRDSTRRRVPPSPGHDVHQAGRPLGARHQSVDQRRLSDPRVPDQDAPAAVQPLGQRVEVWRRAPSRRWQRPAGRRWRAADDGSPRSAFVTQSNGSSPASYAATRQRSISRGRGSGSATDVTTTS